MIYEPGLVAEYDREARRHTAIKAIIKLTYIIDVARFEEESVFVETIAAPGGVCELKGSLVAELPASCLRYSLCPLER